MDRPHHRTPLHPTPPPPPPPPPARVWATLPSFAHAGRRAWRTRTPGGWNQVRDSIYGRTCADAMVLYSSSSPGAANVETGRGQEGGIVVPAAFRTSWRKPRCPSRLPCASAAPRGVRHAHVRQALPFPPTRRTAGVGPLFACRTSRLVMPGWGGPQLIRFQTTVNTLVSGSLFWFCELPSSNGRGRCLTHPAIPRDHITPPSHTVATPPLSARAHAR